MKQLRNKYQVRRLCRALEVSESGYYKYLKEEGKCGKRDEELMGIIGEIKAGEKVSYGYRKVGFEIRRDYGKEVNHKRVYRVMVKYGQLSKIRRKHSSNYRSYNEGFVNIYENKLNRGFGQEESNKVLLTDITEYKCKDGILYISAILDCYRSQIVAYKYSTNNNVDLVLETIRAAIKKRNRAGVLLHSDRGFQYTGMRYKKIAQENGIEISMSGARTPKDNAPMESFFGSLKTESLYIKKPKSIQEAKDLVDEYVEYYNTRRVILKYKGAPQE